jgi:uncharacterized caspase-like protein
VIGNSAYPRAGLRNPLNDAGDLEKILKDLNFDVTTRVMAYLHSRRLF